MNNIFSRISMPAFETNSRELASHFIKGAISLGLLAGAAYADPATTGAVKSTTPPDLTKQHTLYVVGYAHLDTEWCWNYPQVIREFLANTLNNNFAMFDKYPDYTFNFTGANRYKLMKEYYPKEYARMKQYVAEGRWFPDGSSLEEGDVCTPSEESLVRQVLYGNQFFRKDLGTAGDDFILPDCFGFPASLPTILAHCGIKGFSTQKLTWGSAVGIPFNVGRWIGPDGSVMPSALNAVDYNGVIHEDLSKSKDWIKRVNEDGDKYGVYADYEYYGTGDRGGAPAEESIKNLEVALHSGGPLTVIGGRADQLFEDLTPSDIAKLPSYKGDLLLTQHTSGSATSHYEMKRWNRENELLGNKAETSSIIANWLGALPYDQTRITDAWWRFLPGQFHDLLAGTALPKSYEYSDNDQVIAMNEFSDIIQSASNGVARGLNTKTNGIPLVVFNPLSSSRQDIAQATVSFPGAAPAAVKVVSPSGKVVPSQIIGRNGSKLTIIFLASAESVSYGVYDVQPATATTTSTLKVSTTGLENDNYRVTVNEAGDVSSIFDKKASKELLSAPLRFAFQYENPSQYPAWNMDWSDQQKPPIGYVDGPAAISVVENGPVRVSLKIERYARGSKFVQTIRLASGAAGNKVQFSNLIDWKSQEVALKAVLPLTVNNPLASYNWTPGVVERATNDQKKYEVSSHQWFDLTDTNGDYGVSVINQHSYGSDKPDDHTLRMTMLYTPGVRAGYQHQATQDWGRREIEFAVSGHEKGWADSQTPEIADEFGQPLVVFQSEKHPGKLGSEFSFANVSSPNVSIGAIKKAEDSDEIIVRFNELYGKAAPTAYASFAAPIVSAREVDGQERPIGSASIVNGKLAFSMSAFRPRAFAIRLASAKATVPAPASTPIALPYDLNITRALDGGESSIGGFDNQGTAIDAATLPETISNNGVSFNLSAGDNKAVIASGQTIKIPAGKGGKLYIVAASSGDDTAATFLINGKPVTKIIQAWDGYIGQNDLRLWNGEQPELTYGWDLKTIGLLPGYIKRAPVAWYADHKMLPNGKPDYYGFCYLYRYEFDVPAQGGTLTLPKNQQVKIVAASIASPAADTITPSEPLYDVLNHASDKGALRVETDTVNDGKDVKFTVNNQTFFTPSETIHYTLDGQTPTISSPVYKEPLLFSQKATLKAAVYDENGVVESTGSASASVQTPQAPTLTGITHISPKVILLKFSESISKESAENTSNYTISPAANIASAALNPDGSSVTLTLAANLLNSTPGTVSVSGIKANLPDGLSISTPEETTLSAVGLVYQQDATATFDKSSKEIVKQNLPGLPVLGESSWTISAYITPGKLEDLTAIVGFGAGADDSKTNRYIINYNGGISFWGSNVDIPTGVPFEEGKGVLVTMTFDGSAVRIYKNGQFLTSGDADFVTAQPTVILAPNGPWDLGRRFTGSISNFKIWNYALPEDEVKALVSTDAK